MSNLEPKTHQDRWLNSLTVEELRDWVRKNSCLCDMAGICSGCLLANAEQEQREARRRAMSNLGPGHWKTQWVLIGDAMINLAVISHIIKQPDGGCIIHNIGGNTITIGGPADSWEQLQKMLGITK